MDSPHLVSLFSRCLPLLSFHIITMYSPRGWLKGFPRGGEQRGENGGRWQQRRVVLITPCVWTRKGGVEDLFQLINESPRLSLSLSASLSQTLPLEIICLGLTEPGLGTMTEIQLCSVKQSSTSNLCDQQSDLTHRLPVQSGWLCAAPFHHKIYHWIAGIDFQINCSVSSWNWKKWRKRWGLFYCEMNLRTLRSVPFLYLPSSWCV